MALGERPLGVGRILDAWLAILARLALQYLRLYRRAMIFLFGTVSSLVEVVVLRVFLHAACQSPLQPDKKSGLARRASLLEALDVCTVRSAGRGSGWIRSREYVNCCAPL